MRKWLAAALLSAWVGTAVGCVIPAYSGDPERRSQQLLVTSENLRLFLDEWERLWFLDMPSHATPHRSHGGVF